MISSTYFISGQWHQSTNHKFFKYDIIHDFKVSLIRWQPLLTTSKNALGRALPKSRLASSISASQKSATVIWHPPRQGLARPHRPTHPDLLCQPKRRRGLGGIIFWLHAVCRVVLLKVEQTSCKISRLSWAVCMQADQFQPISYINIGAGPPAALYDSWSSSWRVKQGNGIASEDVNAIFLHT